MDGLREFEEKKLKNEIQAMAARRNGGRDSRFSDRDYNGRCLLLWEGIRYVNVELKATLDFMLRAAGGYFAGVSSPPF